MSDILSNMNKQHVTILLLLILVLIVIFLIIAFCSYIVVKDLFVKFYYKEEERGSWLANYSILFH